MTCKSKTPTPFWGQSCAHYGDSYGIPCPHFGDALSLFWGRFSGFLAPPCAHFGDILNNHTPNKLLHSLGTKQAGRQVGPTYRTDGQPAWLHHAQGLGLVPMAAIKSWSVTGEGSLSFSLPKKIREGFAW